MDRGTWYATACGVAKVARNEKLSLFSQDLLDLELGLGENNTICRYLLLCSTDKEWGPLTHGSASKLPGRNNDMGLLCQGTFSLPRSSLLRIQIAHGQKSLL